MISAGQRLANLSGLTGVSAAEHLRQIAGMWGTAGEMLVAYSGLGPSTAAVHLMHDRARVGQFVGYAPGAVQREMGQHPSVDIERQNQTILAVIMAAVTRGIIR